MAIRRKKFMAAVLLFILLLTCLGLVCLGVRESQYHCDSCGSIKHINTLRIPGWNVLPKIYRHDKTSINTSPFYKDFFADTGHSHKWIKDWEATKYFGTIHTSSLPPNPLIMFYNGKADFRKYIQELIKNGEYTRQRIIEATQPGNESEAMYIINDYSAEAEALRKKSRK